MRPKGEVRLAIAMAAAQCPDGATWRELAAMACVGWLPARYAIKDMTRAGELVVVSTRRQPGAARPLNVYAPATCEQRDGASLNQVLTSWAQTQPQPA